MAHSLELRSPFLDRRVAEFAMRLPTHLKLKKRRVKYFTRRLAERYLPHQLVYRRKQGFGFPLALWLRGRLRPLLRRAIEESRLAEAGVFRTDEMMRLAQEHWSGENDTTIGCGCCSTSRCSGGTSSKGRASTSSKSRLHRACRLNPFPRSLNRRRSRQEDRR